MLLMLVSSIFDGGLIFLALYQTKLTLRKIPEKINW